MINLSPKIPSTEYPPNNVCIRPLPVSPLNHETPQRFRWTGERPACCGNTNTASSSESPTPLDGEPKTLPKGAPVSVRPARLLTQQQTWPDWGWIKHSGVLRSPASGATATFLMKTWFFKSGPVTYCLKVAFLLLKSWLAGLLARQ